MGFFTIKDANFNDRVHVHDDGRISDRNFDNTGYYVFGNEVRNSRCETIGHFFRGEYRDNAGNTVGYVKGDTLRDCDGNITGFIR